MGNLDLSYDVKAAKEILLNATGAISAVTGHLTSAASSFEGVVEKIETRIHELDIRETKIKDMETKITSKMNELAGREKIIKEREEKVKVREKEIEDKGREKEKEAKEREREVEEKAKERVREVEEKEEKWKEMEKRIASNVAKLEPLIHMNVGGERFTAHKSDLLRIKGSYFEFMLASEHSQKINGEFFINQDPKPFRHVLNFLRTGQLENPVDCGQVVLEQAFKAYKIPFPVFPFSVLLAQEEGSDPGINFTWQTTITKWLPNKAFNLLYKATRDGFAADDFHRVCDGKGPTLALIQSSEGFLFGGYTPISWDSTNGFLAHPDCFVYTLTNPHSIPPTRYNLHRGNMEAICCSPLYSVTFGGGYDIVVCSNSNESSNSYTNFPHSYEDTTEKERDTFTGNWQFTTRDVEVYSVI
eukprot:Phypoly_transcript_09656.p1 GENE.Phypoly_transcript_09656~~Phypoly_transcript_09656.p1  ORF type:complete len:440 (+),score=86.82 Phypoly_transcript_09656:73-1320(+)